MYCPRCASQRTGPTSPCPNCGAPPPVLGSPRIVGADKKVAAGVCGILLGALGIHKFILGYSAAGVIMLLATICTCGLATPITSVIGLIEGIVYLTKSDEDFVETYVRNERQWF